MLTRLTVATALLATTATVGALRVMAQDARAVIANAQKTLGNVSAVTYSGSARDVAFQQCGANAADMQCRGTHDPTRPINNYVRVIDLAGPASRHTGTTNNIGPGGSTTVSPGTFFQQVSPQQADVSQPWAGSLEFYITPWGFLKGAAENNATVRRRRAAGRDYTVLTWSPTVKAPSGRSYVVNAYVNDQHLVERVETWLGENIMGDMHIVATYTGWKDFGGVVAPSKIVQTRGGWPFFEVTVTAARANPSDVATIAPQPVSPPPAGGGGVPAPLTVSSERLGEGLYRITTGQGSYDSLIVEFRDYVMMLEAGIDWDPVRDSFMFQWPYDTPRRGAATPAQQFGEFDAGLGGWTLEGEPYTTGPGSAFGWFRTRMLGGRTNHWGRISLRYGPDDFRRKSLDGLGDDWPITYDEREPYYTQAERMYHVHGQRGEDPTEPPATASYPHPPVSHEPRIQHLAEDFARLGLSPFHVPLGVMLDERNPRTSHCIRCNTCDGFPCLVGAKADAHVCAVEPALRHPNVTLVTNARVDRLVTDGPGRSVTRIVAERAGAREEYSADVVIVSCGAINSAALLLRSASDRHPNGLGNRSGVVGRHYMGHVNSVLMAISKCPNPTVFQKSLSVNDFYFGSADWDHPMGHISFVGKLDAIALSAGAPPFVPNMTLEAIAHHSLDFWLTSEDLPSAENRVTVERDGRTRLTYAANNEEGHRRLQARLKDLMGRIPCTVHGRECFQGLARLNAYIGKRIPLAGVAHQNGTCRFGSDPRTSVLDLSCRAHEVDNLYVVDGSFFPSSGAVNPALTIMANALRVGDHLAARLGVGARVAEEALA